MSVNSMRRRIGWLLAILFAPLIMILAALISPGPQANICVAPPLKIAGALCGSVFDPTGAVVPQAELRVLDAKGLLVSQATADSKGNFKFPPMPGGDYRLITTEPGFRDYLGQIVISSSGQTVCKKPISAVLSLMSCEGGVSGHRPRRYHEPES